MVDLAVVDYTKFKLDKGYLEADIKNSGYTYTLNIWALNPANLIKDRISEVELTRHAMRLAQSSLEEDWLDEDDAYWESFLDK